MTSFALNCDPYTVLLIYGIAMPPHRVGKILKCVNIGSSPVKYFDIGERTKMH